MVSLVQGDTYGGKILIKDADGVPIDITGWTFYITVKKNINDSDANAYIFKEVTDLSDPTNGECIFYFLPADTAWDVLPSGNYIIELKWETDAGAVYTFNTDTLTVEKTVRKDL